MFDYLNLYVNEVKTDMFKKSIRRTKKEYAKDIVKTVIAFAVASVCKSLRTILFDPLVSFLLGYLI